MVTRRQLAGFSASSFLCAAGARFAIPARGQRRLREFHAERPQRIVDRIEYHRWRSNRAAFAHALDAVSGVGRQRFAVTHPHVRQLGRMIADRLDVEPSHALRLVGVGLSNFLDPEDVSAQRALFD